MGAGSWGARGGSGRHPVARGMVSRDRSRSRFWTARRCPRPIRVHHKKTVETEVSTAVIVT